MHTLVFSPHRGTAAVALPVAMPRWLALGHHVTLVTVFSRSLEAPFSDVDTVHPNDRLTYVSAMRRKEDEQFQRMHPKLTMLDLNLKDAAIRHRIPADEAFNLMAVPHDPATEKIQKALAKLLGGAHSIEAVVLPLGLGGHLDHRVVRDAVLSAEALQTLPVAFYEDQPYASQSPSLGAQTTLAGVAGLDVADFNPSQLPSQLTPLFIASDEAHRLRSRTLSLYASQIDEDLAAAIMTFAAAHHEADRVWIGTDWTLR